MTNATTPHANQLDARWWLGNLAAIKATAADTDGSLTIVEVTAPPGGESPPHVHHREDESFWILEGSLTLHIGEEIVEAGPGDFAFGPRDVPHRLVVGPEGARFLLICAPGGFEGLVIDMSGPAERLELPSAENGRPDLETMARVANAYGCDLLV